MGQPFIHSLSGLSWPLFCFYLWAPMSLWVFLWAFMARLLSLGFPGPITLDSSLGFMGLPEIPYFFSLHCLGPVAALSHFSTSYTAYGMLFLSFLTSLSPLASSRLICLFVGPVIHYFCRLGLMVFCYLFCQFFVALIIGLSFYLPGLSQMTPNNRKSMFFLVK